MKACDEMDRLSIEIACMTQGRALTFLLLCHGAACPIRRAFKPAVGVGRLGETSLTVRRLDQMVQTPDEAKPERI